MLGFFTIAVLVLAGLAAAYWRWRKKVEEELAEGAAIEWAIYQKNEPEFVSHLDAQGFAALYKRVHEPRFPAYVLAAIATFIVSLPIILGFISAVSWLGQQVGIFPEPAELVRYVRLGDAPTPQPWECNRECKLYLAEAYGGFYYFFGVLFSWLAIVAFYMRRFHKRRPGYIRDEIIRAKP